MDLATWLRSLGLQEFEAVFRDNAIDESVLSDLTEDHLRELGFSLGARLKLLKAIAKISANTGVTSPLTEGSSAIPHIEAAERRQVTVMFCDLVNSTALSMSMDPEDLSGVLGEYQKCAADIVRRFGGFVAQYLGDGVLVYFGYPESHEDDAERAVRAGLELTQALKVRTSLKTRIGIATGLVVVGDLVELGRSAGTRHRWQNTKHGRAFTGDRRAQYSRHLR